MPRIYVLSGPDLGRTFELTAGATLGRAAESTVPLHDASVSRTHARLERTEAGWRVVDAGSRNGIFVGRERVAARDLTDGDEFRLGEVLLRFRADAPAAAAVPPAVAPHAPAPAPAPAPEIQFRPMGHSTRADDTGAHDLGEVELEGDWTAPAPSPRAMPPATPVAPATAHGAPANPRSAPVAAPRSAAVDDRARKLAAAGLAPAVRSTDARGVLQFNKVEQRDGLLKQDLEQQPAWVRLAVIVLLVAGAAGLAWLAYQAATAAKARIVPADVAEDETER